MTNKVYNVSPNKEDNSDPGAINPIIIHRYDICPKCGSNKIELMSFNNYPQGYSSAVDAYLSGYNVSFDKYEIRSMKCRSCGKEFVIDWSRGFPIPLKDTGKSNIFFMQFINGE